MQIRMKEMNLPANQGQIYGFKTATIEEYKEWTTRTKLEA